MTKSTWGGARKGAGRPKTEIDGELALSTATIIGAAAAKLNHTQQTVMAKLCSHFNLTVEDVLQLHQAGMLPPQFNSLLSSMSRLEAKLDDVKQLECSPGDLQPMIEYIKK